MTIGLLIADDHKLIRAALRRVLNLSDLTIVGEAATPAEALRLALDPQVQVMLLDIRWSNGDPTHSCDAGLELLEEILSRRAELPILMYSGISEWAYVKRCRELGARGYLVKGADEAQLVKAVRTVYAGEQIWPDGGGTSGQARQRAVRAPERPAP